MKEQKKYIVLIGGPTASGKTDLAIALAKHYQTEIISSDSRQIYREMNIGTAKATPAQLALATHHLISHKSIHDNYNVGDFEHEALTIIDRLHRHLQIVVVCGGTGLYLNALCEGLDEFPTVAQEDIDHYDKLLLDEGLKRLQEELAAVDPSYAERVDLYNPRRLVRALSVYRATGKPFSEFQKNSKKERPFVPIKIALAPDRKALYHQINLRVDQMMADGLLEECKRLYEFRGLKSLQTVGYQELFQHLSGSLSLAEAIEKIKQHSRNYAKRQLTWFRNQGEWQSFTEAHIASIISYIDQIRVR